MIPFLVVAGISIGAAAVRWFAEGKTESLQQEISQLEQESERLRSVDVAQRQRMMGPYLKLLASILDEELGLRDHILPELSEALRQSRQVLQSPLGTIDQNALARAVFELELAIGTAQAERAYLRGLRKRVGEGNLREPLHATVLYLPDDFPREGALVQLPAGVTTLQGYRILREEQGERQLALFAVDHERATAKGCVVRGVLLHAAHRPEETLEVSVVREAQEGLHLELTVEGSSAHAVPVPLLMRLTPHDRLRRERVGGRLKVHPLHWTWDSISRALAPRPVALPVSGTPPITRDARRWSPIPLQVEEKDLRALAQAQQRIEEGGHASRPWRVSWEPDGDIVLSLGGVSLKTRPLQSPPCLRLVSLGDETSRPDISVRMEAELAAFAPGTGDEADIVREQFVGFLDALGRELAEQRLRLSERTAGVRLRKMAMLYEDRATAAMRASSVPLLVTEVSQSPGRGSECLAVILADPLPAWITDAAERVGASRVRAMARGAPIAVQKLRLEGPTASVRLSLGPEVSRDDALAIDRLESVAEGAQERVLQKAAEDALIARFASASVRQLLLMPGTSSVEHGAEGPEQVLKAALAAPDVYAVWGPPGTGKTTFAVNLIERTLRAWREDRPPLILVTAPTHVAVNEIVRRVVDKRPELAGSIVRYVPEEEFLQQTGLEALAHARVVSRYLQTASTAPELDPKWKRLLGGARGRTAATRWLLSGYQLHAATCVGMARQDFALTDRCFDLVLFDEAGKAFGAEVLVPALRARKIVLVGDHKQLPPTVTEEMLDESVRYRLDLEEVEDLLRESFFHQVFTQLPSDRKGMLTTQHRMHPHIGDAVSALFYGGKLSSARAAEPSRVSSSRLTLLDFSEVPGYAERRGRAGTSWRNPEEARAAILLLQRLRRISGRLPSTLLVCPYADQRQEMELLLRQKFAGEDVHATTVDAVQGGEASVVLLLMTRTHGRTSFLLDEHRVNVALSRARDAAFIFCHARHLTREPESPIARLLEHGRQRGTLLHLKMPAHFGNSPVFEQVLPGSSRA
jgi:hypothetical protein